MARVSGVLAVGGLLATTGCASALGTLGQASAIAALEKRKSAEPERRVINAIDAALLALRARRGT